MLNMTHLYPASSHCLHPPVARGRRVGHMQRWTMRNPLYNEAGLLAYLAPILNLTLLPCPYCFVQDSVCASWLLSALSISLKTVWMVHEQIFLWYCFCTCTALDVTGAWVILHLWRYMGNERVCLTILSNKEFWIFSSVDQRNEYK